LATPKKRWKFLHFDNSEIVSSFGMHDPAYRTAWTVGEWIHVGGFIRACSRGLHCSRNIADAHMYIAGDVVARVEVNGTSDGMRDKEAWSDMRIVKAYHWTAADSVALAVYVASLVIGLFEADNPTDKRPRLALDAAKKFLTHGARPEPHHATDVSDAFFNAAGSAARNAADVIFYAVSAATQTRAYDIRSAAACAVSLAFTAAKYSSMPTRDEVTESINTWMENRVKTLLPVGLHAVAS
jgi:hypothetical protein